MDEPMTLNDYIKEKICMLREDFCLGCKLTEKDILALEASQNEIQCDQRARVILDKYM